MAWIVDGPEPVPKTGDVLQGPFSHVNGPFVVLCETDIEDFRAQYDFLRLDPALSTRPEGRKFFRLASE
jgi:hypothetical protein